MCEDKLLTVSIAAYNVADFIKTALDSCSVAEEDSLEVIIVDDGSQDSTMDVAQKYVDEYPNIFQLICKENGGYGSTVNASLDVAHGRYYRLLDGDDWFSTEALKQLLRLLYELDVDVVVNPYVKRPDGGIPIVVDHAPNTKSGTYPIATAGIVGHLSMHSMTYKTEVLRSSGLRLPHKRLYTDALFATYALPIVKTCYISHNPLYQYRLGRDGQSMNHSSMVAHAADLEALTDDLYSLLVSEDPESFAYADTFDWFTGNATLTLAALYCLPPTNEIWGRIGRLVEVVSSIPGATSECSKKSKSWHLLSMVRYFSYPTVSRFWSRYYLH